MPCYDSRNDPEYVRGEERERAFRDFTHNSPVAELLCGVMKQASLDDTAKRFLRNNPGLAKWWADHQARDKARKKK